MSDLEIYIENLCSLTKKAAPSLGALSSVKKNEVLALIAAMLREKSDEIIAANDEDMKNADANGVPKTMLDRLKLNEKRISDIADAINDIIALPDPIGKGEVFTRPNGLKIQKVRAPLGVIAIIYEARPNVTVDAATLCLKAGNAVILRGGKEAINTNRKTVEIMKNALVKSGLNPDCISLVDDITREGTAILMGMRKYVDVLIPRGSRGLIKSVVENSTIPVIETGAGNCHLYVDKYADLDMALIVSVNAKISRPSVCNAIETLLVHSDVAEEFIPRFAKATEEYSLEIRGCERTCKILKDCKAATEDDYMTEYDDYIIALKVVDTIDEAIEHINNYGTMHSEAIMTQNIPNAEKFKSGVDAAAVYVNASTRFTDGGEFGLGAEIGISTQKLHARGPMGLNEITTVKYLIDGNGQIR